MSRSPKSNTWNPKTYLEFATHRERPVNDLIPRLEVEAPGAIYDLGCGPGNVTMKLQAHWPDRAVFGIDSSTEMLNSAQAAYGTDTVTWIHEDIAKWSADQPAAIVFANASLQWVGEHDSLFPRLLSNVTPGGLLAIQVPVTAQAPYQDCIRQVVAAPEWRERLAGIHPHDDVYDSDRYYELLSPQAANIDMWETHYHHILDGEEPAIAWMSGAGLVPILTHLNDADRQAFLADYAEAMKQPYTPQSDGKTIFTMRRLFIVAKRA